MDVGGLAIGAGDVGGICIGVLADAWVIRACPMRRRSMAIIFESFARVHPEYRVPLVSLLALGCVAVPFCFLVAGGRDRGAGGDSHCAAVSGAGDGTRSCCVFGSRNCRGRSACGCIRCLRCWQRRFLFILISRKNFLTRDSLCGGHSGRGLGDLYSPRMARREWPFRAVVGRWSLVVRRFRCATRMDRKRPAINGQRQIYGGNDQNAGGCPDGGEAFDFRLGASGRAAVSLALDCLRHFLYRHLDAERGGGVDDDADDPVSR